MATLPTIEVKVDTTQLNEALRKLELLAERMEHTETLLAGTMATLATAIAVKKPVSRRTLFGLGWLDPHTDR